MTEIGIACQAGESVVIASFSRTQLNGACGF